MNSKDQRHRAAPKVDPEVFWSSIVADSDDAIITKDLDSVITSWNRGAERVFGYAAEEALGQRIFLVIPPELTEEEGTIIERLRRGERIDHVETIRLRKDGTRVPISLTISPIRDRAGNVIGASKIARDITERKESERELRIRVERFELLAEAAHRLLEAAEPEALLDTLYERLGPRFGISCYCHFVVERGQPGLRLRISRGVAAELVRQIEREIAETSGNPHNAMVVADVRASQDPLAQLLKGEGITAYGCFPLATQGQLLGRVCFGTKRPEGLAAQSVQTLRTVADILAAAVARAQSEAALRESEARFRTLADNIVQLTWMADAKGHFYWYNRGWFDYTGTTMEQVEGWGWERVIHPAHLPAVRESWRYSLATGKPLQNVFRMRGKDGNYRWFLARGVPIRNDQGEIVRWLGTNTDITEQRESEERLREQAQLLNLSFDAILVRDSAERIIFWNRGAEELYGWSAPEALGRVSHELLGTEFPEPLESIQAKLHETGRWEGELVHTRRDSSRVRVSSRWVLDRDAKGNPVRVLESNNDISARRRMEVELRSAREQLAQRATDLEQEVEQRTADLRASLAELESVSYSLSHDMRAPLRTIQSFCHIVLTEAGAKLGANEQELLRKAIHAAARLDRLIHDVLIYGRVSRDAIRLSAVDLEQLLRQIIDERPEFQPPAAVIEIQGPLAHVRAHEVYLTQCVTNILENAVKFVSPGRLPNVRIWTEAAGPHVRLWFEDNGIGIPKEALERIFGIFERLHPQQTYPGTGIGLAIVKRAAERMGGAAGVESEPGKGSRFWLQLARGD